MSYRHSVQWKQTRTERNHFEVGKAERCAGIVEVQSNVKQSEDFLRNRNCKRGREAPAQPWTQPRTWG